MSDAWFTTLAAIRAGDPDWQAVAAYQRPISNLLARIAPGLPEAEREDVAQEVLLALRSQAIREYRPERGRFRDYLRGIVRNQVRRALRERRREARCDPDVFGEVPHHEWYLLDAEAWLLRGLARFQDRLAGGREADRQIFYCFSDRVLKGMTYAEIARREGISPGAVSRRLAKARRLFLRCLLDLELERGAGRWTEREREEVVRVVQRAFRERRPLEELVGRKLAHVLPLAEELLGDVRACFAGLASLDSSAGRTFLEALSEVLGVERPSE